MVAMRATNKKIVVYVGYFAAPDGNAAGMRVWRIGEILSSAGFRLVYFQPKSSRSKNNYESVSFVEFEYATRRQKIKAKVTQKQLFHYLRQNSDNIYAIIMYNYSGFLMGNVIRFAKKHGIKTFSDCTEWYMRRGLHKIEINLRMKKYNLKVNGVIAISDFLNDFYSRKGQNVYKLPPLIKVENIKSPDKTRDNQFLFLGTIGKSKERLDLVVGAFIRNPQMTLKIIGPTKNDFIAAYGWKGAIPTNVIFAGKLPHEQCIQELRRTSYLIFLRDINLTSRAGFSTKFAEAFSYNVPIITNASEEYQKYILNGVNGYLLNQGSEIDDALLTASRNTLKPINPPLFSTKMYLSSFLEWFLNA